MKAKKDKYYSQEEALAKLQKYCAYQDRCHQEVRNKLLELKVYGDTLEEIMAELVQEKFLDEERFARSYARGKFRIKKWGRNKILQELKRRHISAYCIKKAMSEIDEEDYHTTLHQIIDKKERQLKASLSSFEKNGKLAQYVIQRGFEAALTWEILKERTSSEY